MFYISSRVNNKFGITDSKDGLEEFYIKEDILKMVNNLGIEIDGVGCNNICVVEQANKTLSNFRLGLMHKGLSTMTLSNQSFGLRFKSRPTNGEMSFVSSECINISRCDINEFSYDRGNSKTYRSGLTLDDILMVLERYSNWSLVECRIGRY